MPHERAATDRLTAAIHRNRGVAVLLALIAVAIAALIGLAIASMRDAATATSGGIVQVARARTASRGALDIAAFVVEKHAGIGAGNAADESRSVFEPKQIGEYTLAATMVDPDTEASPTDTSVAVAIKASATANGLSQTFRALTRLPWPDAVARANLDLSEFGALTTGGPVDIRAGSEVSVWRDAPLAALAEPIVVGTRDRKPASVTIASAAIALGVVKLAPGDFAANQGDAAQRLADGKCLLPADIQIPAAPKQGTPSSAVSVTAAQLGSVVNTLANGTAPHLSVGSAATLTSDMAVRGPIAAGTWRVISVQGALTLDRAHWTIEVPTMLVTKGDLTLTNDARIEVAPGAALTIVSEGSVSVDRSYIGAQLPSRSTPLEPTGGASYPLGGATTVLIYAQPSPSSVRVTAGSVVEGGVYAPDAAVTVDAGSAVYGRVLGGSVTLDGGNLFYDPQLDSGQGWLNPKSGVWSAPNDVRDEVYAVTRLDDQSLAAFANTTGIAVDRPETSMVATVHVAAAGGVRATTATNTAASGTPTDASILPGNTALTGAAGSVSSYPQTYEVRGTLRDFREFSERGGHPDFDNPALINGHRWGLVKTTLSAQGKPQFLTGSAKSSSRQFMDASGSPICWTLYDASRGDTAGTVASTAQKSITSAASFESWFRDDPAINLSEPITLSLQRVTDSTGKVTYVFDSSQAKPFIDDGAGPFLDGFFPLEGRLFGTSAVKTVNGVTRTRNFHFTMELATEFTYKAGSNQIFAFRGDDDVWVFINGALVIDLGGMHSPVAQSVPLDRLGLADGQKYPLKMFFAERRRNGSNFRMATNFPLASPTPVLTTTDPMVFLDAIDTKRTAVQQKLATNSYAPLGDLFGVTDASLVLERSSLTAAP
jgi:fibro-slime domain-containing protein